MGVAEVDESRKFPKTLGLLNCPHNTLSWCLGKWGGRLFLSKESGISWLVQIFPEI